MTKEQDNLYMSHPKHKSVAGFRLALDVFAKYLQTGEEQTFFCEAAHDVFFVHVNNEELPEDSEDGKLLISLGWHVEEDAWSYFT